MRQHKIPSGDLLLKGRTRQQKIPTGGLLLDRIDETAERPAQRQTCNDEDTRRTADPQIPTGRPASMSPQTAEDTDRRLAARRQTRIDETAEDTERLQTRNDETAEDTDRRLAARTASMRQQKIPSGDLLFEGRPADTDRRLAAQRQTRTARMYASTSSEHHIQ